MMKRNLLIVAICIGIISMLLGGALFSFSTIENKAEAIEDTSNNILYDLSSISIFAYTLKDFFEGASGFEIYLLGYQDESGNLNGHWEVVFHSYRDAEIEGYIETIRREQFIISTAEHPISESDANAILERFEYPIKPFIEWEREPYNGVFGAVINAVQFLAYILGMIWGALSLVLLVLIDTVTTAWELIRLSLSFIGLS